ncbi:tubulin-specific chaperone D-like [Rhopilema esculentum]|uniref:tubulin-specific chaperone D-like n=1 Tax=Rhopilema esculentum TaxID=499914 RepID=UPI0031DFE326
MKCNVFPSILLLINSTDLNTRHGALLAVAEVGEAIYSVCADKSGLLDGESLHRIENIVSFLKENNYFNGLEGDFMRTAVCKLIEKFSAARIPINWNVVVGDWQEMIDECLAHTVAWIQDMGVVAFHELCKCFYGRKGAEEPGNSLVDRFLEKLQSSFHFDRMGYALGLGALPASMIEERKTKIIDGLLQSLVIQEKTAGIYAEPRRNAVKALTRICEELGLATTGEENNGINEAELQKILESFFTSMQDYSVDSRGDVGAWVREEAMTGLEKLCKLMVAKDVSICPQNLGTRVFCCLVQQSAEKIDRTRGHAGETLLRMVHMKPPLPDIPHHQELREVFPESDIEKLNWTVPSVAFSNIIKLLPLPAYRHSVLLGITVSVGGLTESLVRHSSESLLQYIGSIQSSNKKMNEFTSEILTILEENKKNDRVVLPMLRMVDLLISNGCFDMLTEESASEFSEKLATLLKCEVAGSGDTKKLMSSIKVFCGLLQFSGEGRSRSLSQLMLFLCQKYPLVRKETAETLYTTLITFEEVVDEENLEEVLTKLSDTEWDDNVEELRERRNAICNLLGVPVPKLKKKANKNKGSSEPKDALESYQDLVTRHGY